MRGNSHVRFGAGDEETCLGNEARRFIPTLPANQVRTLTLRLCRRQGWKPEGRRSDRRSFRFADRPADGTPAGRRPGNADRHALRALA